MGVVGGVYVGEVCECRADAYWCRGKVCWCRKVFVDVGGEECRQRRDVCR